MNFSEGYALTIYHNSNLAELRLKSLKKIKNGQIYIGNNQKLCYVETMHEYWSNIITAKNLPNEKPMFRIVGNQNQTLCGKIFMILWRSPINPLSILSFPGLAGFADS